MPLNGQGNVYTQDANEAAIIRDNVDHSYGILTDSTWPTDRDNGWLLVWQGPKSQLSAAWAQYAPSAQSGLVAKPTPTPIGLPNPDPRLITYPWNDTSDDNAPGDPGGYTPGSETSTGGLLMVSGGASNIAAKLGPSLTTMLKNAIGGGSRITADKWSAIPGWMKSALLAVGISEGTEFSLDNIIGGITASGDYNVGGVLNNHQIVKTWQAGPTRMGMLANGTQFAVRRDGRVKTWRPRKPVAVIYSDGAAGDVRKLVRADRALNKQAKEVDSLIKRRAKSLNTTKKKGKA